ncbi:hypothetical protein VTJ83DRAFT_783 [Remersonia thermophila]|uniref:Secreted protein n=1 Tax=Remersonia thermophila TaxID=72144 RepID=A0ABR4DNR0_9PEZI
MGLLSNLTLLLAATSAVVADTAATPAVPKISSITFSGSGCVKDPKFSGTFNDPTLTFSNFAAALPGKNQTTHCQAHIQASNGSKGWQFALKSNTVRGHVVLQPGTSLTRYTTIFFSQNPTATGSFKDTITNDGNKTINRAVVLTGDSDSRTVWSPCIGSDGYTGILNVNLRAVLSGDAKAYFEANSEEWDVEWRKC